MPPIVVSEGMRRVLRTESYSSDPGPAIPHGLMHGKSRHSDRTLCGLGLVDTWHVWPDLAFPRTYGSSCADCVSEQLAVIDLRDIELVADDAG